MTAATAYLHARLHARHGRRPDATAWRALDATRTAAHALAVARGGPLAPWVDALDADADAHGLEAGLRAQWHRHVDEVARWQPARWQAATRWFGTLPDLGGFDGARRRGGRMHEAHEAQPPHAARAGATADAEVWPVAWPPPLTSLPGAAATPSALAAWWLHEWRARWPAGARAQAAALEHAAALLLPTLRGPVAGPGRGGDDDRAHEALRRLWRRHAMTPVAVFAHLALAWLDVERLRGRLVARRLLAPPAPTEA